MLEVCPDFQTEFMIIENRGFSPVDLMNWSLSDGEGLVLFRTKIVLGEGERLIVTSSSSIIHAIYPDHATIEYPSEASLQGRFALANDGDEVGLRNETGVIVDGFEYGSSSYSGPNWSGPPVGKVAKGGVAHRSTSSSMDASGWEIVPPGRSCLIPEDFDAVVEPFSSPEDALPRIVREINLATRFIKACVYELSSTGG